jgi:nicotinate phosphoribosyltransferase
MTLFNQKRLNQGKLKLDMDGIRRGWYSDKYFENIVQVLSGAYREDYHFAGRSPRLDAAQASTVKPGEIEVEAQIFNRRKPYALVAGVDAALAMLRHATGYFEDGQFVETWDRLRVEAVQDGVFSHYEGDTEDVEPVIRIHGCYRDFGLLETTMLGVLTRASRVATNVYDVLAAARGKPVLFFPARFDLPEVQAVDGYAYAVAIERYNHDTGAKLTPAVSTDAQAAWWGGRGGGTVPHALIACFLADTAEAMVAFARYVPPEVSRVALVDFENDTVAASLATIGAYWPHYQEALRSGDIQEQKRWTLNGVRLDTSGNMRDVSLEPDGPLGVNPQLVQTVRGALDGAWQTWDVAPDMADSARAYCRNVKIVVSGGFNAEKIQRFESENVPVDIYGVGSTLFRNDSATSTDYTMDLVRVKVGSEWVDMAKLGRKPNDNPDLQPVDLSVF